MAGCEHGLSMLYLRYGGEIRRRIASKLSCAEDIDDLYQEVFLRAHRALSAHLVEHPRAYLHQIAVSVVTDHFRRGSRRSAKPAETESVDDDLGVANADPTPEEAIIGYQTLLALQSALERMPAKPREAVLLRALEDLSYREVAVRMGITVKTVEKHLARGMAELRASVQQ